MNKILIIFCLIGLFSCSVIRKTGREQLIFKEINHGIYKTNMEKIEKQSNSPSGNYLKTYGSNLIKTTDTIPGELGIEFGFTYRIKSNENKDIELKKVWIFPQTIIDNQGNKFNEYTHVITVKTNWDNYTCYVLEKDFEIVKGKWILKLYSNDNLLYEKYFIIK